MIRGFTHGLTLWQRFATRLRLWGFVGILLVLLVPPIIDPADAQSLREMGQWLDLPANVAQADAVIVMGGDWRRLAPGVELFQQGFAPQFWYTGSATPARATLFQVVKMGVPVDATTHLLGANTWEETRQIALTMQEYDLHRVLIVTSWYHGRRTLCTLRQHLQEPYPMQDVEIYYQPVGYDAYGPDNWWLTEIGRKTIFSEVTKLGYYWLHYGLALQNC